MADPAAISQGETIHVRIVAEIAAGLVVQTHPRRGNMPPVYAVAVQ